MEDVSKMDATWKNEFEPWIFARGRKYFDEGKINQITQEGSLKPKALQIV